MQTSEGEEASDQDGTITLEAMLAARRTDLQAIVDAANLPSLRPSELGEFCVATLRADTDILEESQIGADFRNASDGVAFRHILSFPCFERLNVAACAEQLLAAANEFIRAGPSEGELE